MNEPEAAPVEFDRLMAQEPQGSVLDAGDDSFHAPASDDPCWTETAWFGFSVPERRLSCAIYPLFRPNLGLCAAGVYVWDHTGEALHEILYGNVQWYLPMPAHDLTELRLGLGQGLEVDRLSPLQRYRVHYADAEVEIDVDVEGLHEPFAIVGGGQGHFEQMCRVRGLLRLHGQDIDVDSLEMRDRSWSVRSDTGPLRGAFSYGTTGGGDVLQVTAAVDGELVTGGWRLVDGDIIRIVGGRRSVERTSGRPMTVVLDVEDERGGSVRAEGVCANRFMFQSTPRIFAWMSLVRWSIDGVEAWGEDQDGWSLDQLRSAFRAPMDDGAPR